ncbi:TPA: sigma-70 family RNA polymerase sigma factor [Streptococcus suis]|nr:sigma-70 family RNA polymerase sigma factor [Streptococcus suis]HEM6302272.1 sigma-70 family RNA polymerase sigma factor [Streptococcus suis]
MFELRWIHERTPEEIAELTGTSEKMIRKRLERIIEIFADYWGWS